MSVESPCIFIQSGGETAERARRALHALTGIRGGIVQAGDLAVTENGTPNMTVNVATGQVAIPGTEATYQGVYVIENRGTLNVTIAAADPTNARKDLIVAKVRDAAYSGASNDASIVAVTGTPSGSPAEPAVPANAWVLAMVDVPANDTAITNSQITDRRTTQSGQLGRASALGGFITCTSTARPAHLDGRVIYETDTDLVRISDGSVWRVYPNSNQSGDVITFAPAGNTDTASSGTFATWISVGNITVPSWATACRYQASVTGILLASASTAIKDIRLKVGSIGAGTNEQNRLSFQDTANIDRHAYSWGGRLSSISTGSQAVVIEYLHVSGAGQIRADVNSRVQVLFTWES